MVGALQFVDGGVGIAEAQESLAPVQLPKRYLTARGRGFVGGVRARAIPARRGQVATELQAIGAIVRHERDHGLRIGDTAKGEQRPGAGAGALVGRSGRRLPSSALRQAEHGRPVLQLLSGKHIDRVDGAAPRIPHLRASRLLQRTRGLVQLHQIVGSGNQVGIAAGALVGEALAH